MGWVLGSGGSIKRGRIESLSFHLFFSNVLMMAIKVVNSALLA